MIRCQDRGVDKEIFEPLRRPPWRLLASRWPWLSIVYLTGTVALSVVTWGFIIVFPLLPGWMQAMGEIETRRSNLLLPPRQRLKKTQSWDWRAMWDRIRSILGWRQAVLTILVVAFALGALIVSFVVIVFVGTTYQVITGYGIDISERVVATNLDPWWQRALAVVVLLILVGVGLYLLMALALLEVAMTRAVLGTDALEQQVARFSARNTELMTAFEAERQRIERELHDGPQQHLANAAIQLGLVRALLSVSTEMGPSGLVSSGPAARSGSSKCAGPDTSSHPSGPDASSLSVGSMTSPSSSVAVRLELAQSEIEAAADALREALHGLRPRTLVEDGLGADIAEMAAHSPIQVEVAYEVRDRLDPAMEASLHFVVAEFLSNTYRHARATHVQIRTWESDGTLNLVMNDDGVGGANPLAGTGIMGMENRARLMGGTLEVSSPPGGPTEIRLHCPVTRAEPTDGSVAVDGNGSAGVANEAEEGVR